jgi:acetylornithine deacetylase/succinyl-diaminopimelate desuccinylase-like protein
LRTVEILRFLKRELHRKDLSDIEVETFNRCESYVTSPKDRLVRLVQDNARRLWSIEAMTVVRPGYTDGRFFRRSGVPTVVYGPRVFHMGGPDEYIEEETCSGPAWSTLARSPTIWARGDGQAPSDP